MYVYTVYKGEAVPLQAWTDPEGSRKLRFPDFVITAQDGGKVVSLTHLLRCQKLKNVVKSANSWLYKYK